LPRCLPPAANFTTAPSGVDLLWAVRGSGVRGGQGGAQRGVVCAVCLLPCCAGARRMLPTDTRHATRPHLLAARVAVHLRVQHQDVDVLAARQHVVQPAKANVVRPAVAALPVAAPHATATGSGVFERSGVHGVVRQHRGTRCSPAHTRTHTQSRAATRTRTHAPRSTCWVSRACRPRWPAATAARRARRARRPRPAAAAPAAPPPGGTAGRCP
jgi:hypothetical protein